MGRTRRTIFTILAMTTAIATTATATPATSAEPGDYYGALLGGLLVPDYQRNTERGINFQGLAAMSLDERIALEASVFYSRTQVEGSGGGAVDNTAGGTLDLHLGRRLQGRPFLLLGAGGQGDNEEVWPLFTAGVGFYPPIKAKNDLLRIEARLNTMLGEDGAGDGKTYNDFRINVGVAFGARKSPMMLTQAQYDSDGDGVPDAYDQCPNTPEWMRVDATGCGPDADKDGVPDAIDMCPNTPTTEKANDKGCGPSQRDTDGDSVTDDRDRCPDTGRDVPVDEFGCIDIEKALLTTVHFGLMADGPTAEGFRILDHVAAAMRARPEIRLEIHGHADQTGDDSYNVRLSTRRAYAVREYLVYKGIEPARFKIWGEGEDKPVASNRSDEGRAMNRRVDFHIIP